MHYFFSIQNNYYTFQTVILHLIILYNYVCVCVLYYGGHHDSDRMAVLVWSSRLEIIVFVNTTNLCILCQIKISFLPSFLPSFFICPDHVTSNYKERHDMRSWCDRPARTFTRTTRPYTSPFNSIQLLYSRLNSIIRVQVIHNNLRSIYTLYCREMPTVEPLLYDHPRNHIGVVI